VYKSENLKSFAPRCQWAYVNLPAHSTDVMKCTEDLSATTRSNFRLSVCMLLILQRIPKLGYTKPSTGLQVGHR